MPLPTMTQVDLIDSLSEQTGYSKSEIRVTLAALNDVVASAMENCERVKLVGLTIEPALRKATKKRMGRNPQTGEEVEVAAKPASVRVKLTANKPLKDAVPSVQKLRKRLS